MKIFLVRSNIGLHYAVFMVDCACKAVIVMHVKI